MKLFRVFFFFSSGVEEVEVCCSLRRPSSIRSQTSHPPNSRLPRVGQDVSVLRHDADADLVGRALDAEADVHIERGNEEEGIGKIVEPASDDGDVDMNFDEKKTRLFLQKSQQLLLRNKKGTSFLSLSSQLTATSPTRMEGRARRERAPKRGAAALAALTRLRGGGDGGAADAAPDANNATAAAAGAPSRRRRQLDEFEVKDADAVYDVVDEDEYADLVAMRRREGGEVVGRRWREDGDNAIEKMRVEKRKESGVAIGAWWRHLSAFLRSAMC
jgi:hypothetical protein